MAKSITYNAQTKTTEIVETPDLPIEPMPEMPPPPPTLDERVTAVESEVDAVVNALAEVILI